jgi:xylose dehydrogenase (NAD/NADP)
MEGFMWRYHPQTEALVRRAREIGPVRVVRAAFAFDLPPDPTNVRLQRALEGGALMDVGCYCVSALRLLCGEPERVTGEAVSAGDGVDGRFAGVLRFAGGVLGLFDCGFDVPLRGAIEVVGAQGTLLAQDPWHGVSPRLELTHPDGAVEEIPVDAVNPYQLELEDFSAAIRDGRPPRLGRADAVGQARAIEALYAAAKN